MAPPYRANVLCPVLNGIPIIANLDQQYSRFPKIERIAEMFDESGKPQFQKIAILQSNQQTAELDISYWAYSPDNLWCIAIMQSRNQNIVVDLISDFGLKVKSHEEADRVAEGWPKNNPKKCGDISLKLSTPKRIDSETVEVTTECCVGCNYNPDGRNSLVVTLRKEAEVPDFPMVINKQVKDVFLDESETLSRLVMEHTNGTHYSAILSSKEDKVDFGRATIDAVRTMLDKFGKKKVSIAQGYIEQKINDYAFLYDSVTLAKNVAFFGQKAQNLFDIGNSTDLMHNRVIAQLMYEYQMWGSEVSSIPTNCLKPKEHDLNIGDLRCEVKTIQTFGEFESVRPGRVRLSPSYHSSLINAIRRDVADAQEQVGKGDMIVFSFWSYMLNALLEAYFLERRPLAYVPPITPLPNTTLLVLTANDASRNHYVAFPTNSVLSSIEAIFDDIQRRGVPDLPIQFIHSGMAIVIGTGNIPHSTAGLSFPMGKL